MDDLAVRTNVTPVLAQTTLRDCAAPIFRHRRLALLLFVGIFVGAIAAALIVPPKYEAEMKILLNRDRADVIVTPEAAATNAANPAAAISEEDINSEVALIKSRDLIEQVVRVSGLEPAHVSPWQEFADILGRAPVSSETNLARAVETLEDRLTVEPLKKTNLIRVAYASRDPRSAALVLQNLARLYQEKHAAVHRPAGTFGFFDDQVTRYHKELDAAEMRLVDFDQKQQIIAPDAQKQLALQQLTQFQAELEEDRTVAVSAGERVRALRSEQSITPLRQTTQAKKLDDAQMLADLETTLLSLELKRADLLTKYAPEYPPVQEIETQIRDTNKLFEQARQAPIEEIVTDRVPAQDWIATEVAKAEADRAQFQARAAATQRVIRRYQQLAQQLDQASATQADLARDAKAAEDDYLLYLHKREEARISDELDRKRIVNVSVAEAATIPALPTLQLGWLLVAGFFTASALSIGAAYAVDRLDPSFRTPDELHRYLDMRVLAAIPASTAREN